jgi:chloride channel 7
LTLLVVLGFRREFTTAGVAAGVAAGFNAPVGGLLFAMEDLSSFWGRRIAWQTFICATTATAFAQLLNKSFKSFQYQGSFGRLETSVSLLL